MRFGQTVDGGVRTAPTAEAGCTFQIAPDSGGVTLAQPGPREGCLSRSPGMAAEKPKVAGAVTFPLRLGPHSTSPCIPREAHRPPPRPPPRFANRSLGVGSSSQQTPDNRDMLATTARGTGRGGIFSFLPWARRELGFEQWLLLAFQPALPSESRPRELAQTSRW